MPDSESDRLKFDALTRLSIADGSIEARPLQDIIRDASNEAAANGLSQEFLRKILADNRVADADRDAGDHA